MGLDMYLEARVYVQAYAPAAGYGEEALSNLEEIEAQAHYNYVLKSIGLESLMVDGKDRAFKGLYVEVPVGQWRKANQILRWIEKNAIEADIENCRSYTLELEMLSRLKQDCAKVLATVVLEDGKLKQIDESLAELVLPPLKGFFFGNYTYDEWYVQQLQETVQMIEAIETNPELNDDDVEFQFRAWW